MPAYASLRRGKPAKSCLGCVSIMNVEQFINKAQCSRGEMDITNAFEAFVPGSSPGGSTILIMNLKTKIPPEISAISNKLSEAGYEAYLVGGCTRDLIIGRKPKDWDIATNAKPEQIVEVFGSDETFYENDFGTVTVKCEDATDPTYRNVEITPYRREGKYSDKRRPDSVEFSDKLEDDLLRRDFTINAIAYDPIKDNLVDPYQGQDDIKDKLVRAVGNPIDRFEEDTLRLIRAVRIATELDFAIESATASAILAISPALGGIAKERIQTEFTRIIMSDRPLVGIVMCQRLGLLAHIMPELMDGIDCGQNGDHIYDVWEHNLRAVQHSADRAWPLNVRLGALLHDVGKPATRRHSDEKNDWTFYGHDVVGSRMAKRMLEKLKYSNEIVEKVEKLVRRHLFFSDIDKITLSAVRRIVSNVGHDLVWDLMNVRACDRIGMGRPKEKPYRLRKYESMIEEAMRAPVSVGMLKIDGGKIMEVTGEKPGPRLGWILHALLEEVLDDPAKNTEEYLEAEAKKLASYEASKLKELGEAGKDKKQEKEDQELGEIRKKYGVK